MSNISISDIYNLSKIKTNNLSTNELSENKKKHSITLTSTNKNNSNDLQNLDINNINYIFKELYGKREPNYFEDKLESNMSDSPIVNFLVKYCKSSLKEMINFKKVKSSNKLSNYYIFVLQTKIVFTKDYEDPCEINFCCKKNPILYLIDIDRIENFFIDKSNLKKYVIKLNVIDPQENRGNLM